MIAALAFALQVGLAPPGVLTVRAGAASSTVQLAPTSSGPAVAPERFSALLGVSIQTTPAGRYLLTAAGVTFELSEQVPFARVGAEVIPLVGAPYMSGGRLHVPLQVLAELVPRFVRGASFDPSRSELRLASAVTAAAGSRAAASATIDSPSGSAGAANARPAPAGAGAASSPGSSAAPARGPGNPPGPPSGRRRIVVVDAGHGGHDPGTSGRARNGATLVEKDVALAVARLLEVELRKRNVDVVMTRSSDVFVPLPERGRIANEQRGDLFISVHVNASAPRSRTAATARGIETYFLAVAKTEDAQRVADMENASIRFEAVSHVAKEDPLSFIINDMAENEHLRESSELAATVQKRLTARQPAFDRGVKQGPFRVLVTSYMPAVLVEVGYATNVDDATLLLDPAHQRQLAEGIAAAAMDYFEDYDRRVGIGGRKP